MRRLAKQICKGKGEDEKRRRNSSFSSSNPHVAGEEKRTYASQSNRSSGAGEENWREGSRRELGLVAQICRAVGEDGRAEGRRRRWRRPRQISHFTVLPLYSHTLSGYRTAPQTAQSHEQAA